MWRLDYLTPDQREALDEGWDLVIVVGPFDIDTLHAALTGDYHDATTEALWQNIKRQINQHHFLRKMGEVINAMELEER